MGQILQFRLPVRENKDIGGAGLDLMSAIDFAIRDLAEIASHRTLEAVREQAIACREMLEDAFHAELDAAAQQDM